ncbi:MAG: Ig-like domain-containing protein [Myxococcaceae bacterium]|nr:Ig-like domain-containing protein [Myxococcaceae bacterium]
MGPATKPSRDIEIFKRSLDTRTSQGHGERARAVARSGRRDPSLTVAPSHPPALTSGTPLLLTASVEGGEGDPSGTVSFLDGDTVLGTAPLDARQARLNVPGLAAGRHVLRASYGGDLRSAASISDALDVAVSPPGTTPDGGGDPGGPDSAGCGCGAGGPPFGAGLLLLVALARATRRTVRRLE